MVAGFRRTRLPHALLSVLLVILLAGQGGFLVLGDDAGPGDEGGVAATAAAGAGGQQQTVVGATGEMETTTASAIGSLPADDDAGNTGQEDGGVASMEEEDSGEEPEKTPEASSADSVVREACLDPSVVEQEREVLGAQLRAAEKRLESLQHEAEVHRAEHEAELSSCASDKATIEKEAGKLRADIEKLEGYIAKLEGDIGKLEDEIEKLKGDIEKLDGTAVAERKDADRRAAEEKSDLQGKLDAAQEELGELRSKLSGAEKRESEAREEAGKHARDKEEVGRVLERTTSELKMAQKPREVSVSAIFADVRELTDDLVRQSRAARDDITARAAEHSKKAKDFVQPHIETVVDAAAPLARKAMVATESHRAQAGELYASYRGKFDEAVGDAAGKKWLEVKAEVLKATREAMSKWEEAERALMEKLVGAGLREEQALKLCKYVYMVLMAMAAVIFLFYLGSPILNSIVLPLVRTALRLAIWVVFLPLRILFLPVRLVFWVLGRCFRLVFGGGSRGGGGSAGVAANAGGRGKKGAARQAKAGRGGR